MIPGRPPRFGRSCHPRAGPTLAAAAMVFLLGAAPVVAQDLRGLVTLPEARAGAGVRVELHSVSDSSGALVDSTRTDASGQFEFSFGERREPGSVFLVGARYGGVLYWGPPIHATSPEALEDYAVSVFDTALVANPVESLRTTMRHVVITPGPAGMQVDEIIDVNGTSDRTLLPAGDSALVWTESLSQAAHGVLASPGGVAPEDLAVSDASVGFSGALPPTGIRVALQYAVASARYDLTVDHPTERLEVLVVDRPGLDVKAEGLTEASVSANMGMPVRRFTASDVEPGSRVSIQAEFGEPAASRPWVWLLLSLSLGAAALLSIRLGRTRS